MICYCPYCTNDLAEPLKNGVIFCQKCSRIVTSDKQSEIISAYKFIKKQTVINWNKVKFYLQLNDADIDLLRKCYEEEELSPQEFENYIKKILCV